MATLVLPVRSDAPFYSVEVDLEGASFTLQLYWNARDAGWYLSFYDREQACLVSGRKVVLGAHLLGPSADARLPPGLLLAIDTTGKDQEAGRDDLGVRVQLVYVESTGPE